MFMSTSGVYAQATGPGNPGGGPIGSDTPIGGGAPIGGGSLILIGLAAVYGVKKYNFFKDKEDKE